MVITPETRPQEYLSFIVAEQELPKGVNIEKDLDEAMAGYGGTLQYWKPNARVGQNTGFDRDYFQTKTDLTIRILETHGYVDPDDIKRTQDFIDDAFDIYEGKKAPLRKSNSFAFVAATRVQRHQRSSDSFAPCDYRRETVGCMPILKYLDEPSSQKVMVGLPPFVLDYYGEDDKGGGGIMIFSPLFLDLLSDSGDKAIDVGMNVAQETSWFAKERLDVKLMSLAALLPKHTGYGALFKYPGIKTTTGHGGTTWLIGEVARKAIEEEKVEPTLSSRIGVLGVGGIGFAVAHYLLETSPGIQIAINDHDARRQSMVSDSLREKFGKNRVLDKNSIEELLKFGGVTVSAITRAIDLTTLDLHPGDLKGRVYVDDSQPAAIASEQVKQYGGLHVGVIAEDRSKIGALTGKRFNYGGMGPKELTQAYGCCAEGAAIFYTGNLEKDAITAPVEQNPEVVKRIGGFCTEMGITPARLQTLFQNRAIYV